jgi:arginyl-tRNA synthetase
MIKEILQTIKDEITENIKDLGYYQEDMEIVLEIPKDRGNGDYSTNVAMRLARVARKAPMVIANEIIQKFNKEKTYVSKIEAAGSGFINFTLDIDNLLNVILLINKEKSNYGNLNLGNHKKVMVEFVSANPTGPMHIGNARGGAIGDCLASVLNWAGYTAEREFYVNDAGNQIEKFGKSLDLRYMQLCSENGKAAMEKIADKEELIKHLYDLSGEGMEFEMPEDVYLGMDIIEHALNFLNINGNSYAESTVEERRKALVDYALPINIAGLERDLKKYRIIYDNWFKESVIHERNETKTVVDKLLENGNAYELDGAVWFKATDYGMDKDFVLRRSNGLYTYIVPDIAYHYDKLVTRNFDKAINILGADHHGYVPRLKAALTALGVDASKLDVILMQMVRLVRNGETVKLSKRSGKAITLVTLLDEIPIDAARFYFNLREANSQFEFDLDLAVEKSSQNPVFYVQYAHARICSLMANLAGEGITLPENADLTLLSDTREIELIRHLASLPREVELAAKNYDPSKLTKYAVDTATLFHRFYDGCSVKNAETPELMNSRIVLAQAVRQVLRNVLTILKIDCPEKM